VEFGYRVMIRDGEKHEFAFGLQLTGKTVKRPHVVGIEDLGFES